MTKLKKPREALVEASEDGLLVKSQDPEFLLRECTGFSCRRPASSPSARNTGIVDDFGVPGRTNPRSAEFQPAWVFANGMFGLVFCLNSRKARSWRFGTGKKPIVIKTVILAKYHVHKDDETEPLGKMCVHGCHIIKICLKSSLSTILCP
ncbi:hypothetical protein IGI04_030120 [Brassica rapa subsp. trilocularis]|uniref:Uncharacterized protein n=1 Tax=Brassica rapa subsp. trilocularis TaxID=1813537 RepID=A0ABQ7LPS4_BRACM|nr:hypothetical protein IGI04_030120 [Brassica rapa subsp. trilocularis]